MCTALVVREEFWDKQLYVKLKLFKIDIEFDTLERYVKYWKYRLRDLVLEIERQMDIMFDICKILAQYIKGGLCEAFEELAKCLEYTFTSDDSSSVPFRKNRQNYNCRNCLVGQNQYYKSQFRLTKMNYNVMNHDRRC